jgi:hypothetical protein
MERSKSRSLSARESTIVPYEIAGRATTLMQVVYRGTPSSTRRK